MLLYTEELILNTEHEQVYYTLLRRNRIFVYAIPLGIICFYSRFYLLYSISTGLQLLSSYLYVQCAFILSEKQLLKYENSVRIFNVQCTRHATGFTNQI